jgi:hypothetical protein
MPPTLYQYLTRCAKTLAVAATATSLVVLAEVAILGYRTPKLPHATLGDLSGTVTPPSDSNHHHHHHHHHHHRQEHL